MTSRLKSRQFESHMGITDLQNTGSDVISEVSWQTVLKWRHFRCHGEQ